MPSGFIIKRTDDGPATFFTLKVGQDFAAGVGGWSADQRKALRFGRASDVHAFANAYLKPLAPWCEPHAIEDDA